MNSYFCEYQSMAFVGIFLLWIARGRRSLE